MNAQFEGNYLAAKGLGINNASELARVCLKESGYKRIVEEAVKQRLQSQGVNLELGYE
jgi:hypothetical protein